MRYAMYKAVGEHIIEPLPLESKEDLALIKKGSHGSLAGEGAGSMDHTTGDDAGSIGSSQPSTSDDEEFFCYSPNLLAKIDARFCW